MCGIAGYVHFDSNAAASGETVKRMTGVLNHRGPDGEGFFVSGNVALGHRRLAIIDLATGDQPMFNDDGSIAVIQNGEIYNYIEVRQELISRGHVFRTGSDTEVIIRAYEEWGTACLERFNGMWACALWDSRHRRLFCSRDRLGEKPLYYAIHENTLVFGSEIKALWSFGVPKRLAVEMLDAYLCFGYVPAPFTAFEGISKLPPGHMLLVEDGKVKVERYWDVQIPDPSEARRDRTRILEEFESLFVDSIRLRMRSDVPLGAFLSGGLDSGAVVAGMAETGGRGIRTFTVGFEDSDFDERKMARLVAERFHTEHVERTVKPGDAEALLKTIAGHFDEPFGDSSALPTYIVSRLAREQVTVALTGDGGDEVLSGYTIHQGEKFSRQYGLLPAPIRNGLIPGAVRIAKGVTQGGMKRRLLRAERVVESARLDFIDRVEAKQSCCTSVIRERLLRPLRNVRPAREFITDAVKPVAHLGNMSKLDYWLLKVSLPDDMLCKVDRMSMASALETRVPFLDHRIVELLASSSMDIKLDGYNRKRILKETLGRNLPDEVLRGKKRGFNVPVDRWLGSGYEGVFLQRARECAQAGWVDPEGVEDVLGLQRQGGDEGAKALWTLTMLSYAA